MCNIGENLFEHEKCDIEKNHIWKIMFPMQKHVKDVKLTCWTHLKHTLHM